jgi:outer membrane protein assembly factor BamB
MAADRPFFDLRSRTAACLIEPKPARTSGRVAAATSSQLRGSVDTQGPRADNAAAALAGRRFLRFMMRIALLAGALATTLAVSGAAHADPSVLTYHGALDRSGRYVIPGLTYERARGLHLDASFHPSFRGAVYAQPLLWREPGSGKAMLIVATDQDEVHAIDAESGAQIWERTLGEPAPRSALPCGNLPTLGVTGAPVIDPARATLYLDAMVMRANEPRHEIYALALADGSIESGWPVDVATALKGSFIPSVQNERGALALFAGRVYVPYSGHYGDCGDYHGFVVGVSETDPAKVESFATRARGGGIWGQGGVVGDGKSLFVATGNTFDARAWSDGEAVLRFGPGLARSVDPRDYFAPANWSFLDGTDRDLGGTAPIPLDVPSAKGVRRLIFAVGKSGDAYLLDRDNLGGIGHPLSTAHVMANVTMASPAVWRAGDAVFVALQGYGANCPPDKAGKGLVALKISVDPTPAIETAWCAAVPGNRGSPIVTTTDGTANPIVFIVGAEADNRLYAFRGDTGELIASPPEHMRGFRRYETIIAAGDRLYAASGGQAYAFGF